MLQVFHMDVAYVAITIHVCFKRMFRVFQTYVASVSYGCCKSRSRDVTYVAMDIHACFKCFICFRCILQMFHLDVSKVDLEEHILQLRGDAAATWAIDASGPYGFPTRPTTRYYHGLAQGPLEDTEQGGVISKYSRNDLVGYLGKLVSIIEL
jgi:hypothetical protein